MDTRSRVVLHAAVAAAAVSALVALMSAPVAAAAVTPYCGQPFPVATDGTLTLDTPTVQQGTQALAVLSDFDEWPTYPIGGGSGETFVSCTPWAPNGKVELMPVDTGVGLFLVDVPPGTPPGTYPVSVLFHDPAGPLPPAGTRRLSTTLTVTTERWPVPSTGVACALPGDPAAGELVGDEQVVAGRPAHFSLTGHDTSGYHLNWVDRLWFVACVDGRAVPIRSDVADMPSDVEVALPVSLAPGPHTVRLWAGGDGRLRWWERTVTVVEDDRPSCERPFPAATDGTLVLDTPTVEAGSSVLGVLTGFDQWPQALIGGGSGETFVSCAPWQPDGDAEAMVVADDVALFLLHVPPGTSPGTYPVGVLFYEGSEDAFGRDPARLSTTVTVTAEPVEPRSNGAACSALSGDPAGVRELRGGDGAVPGGVARLTLTEPSDVGTSFNEYDRLWFVACIDGLASPVVHEGGRPVDIDVRMPAPLAPGPHLLRLWGIVDGVVWWERTITVAAPADSSQLAVTGTTWPPVAAGAVLLLLGGLAGVAA